MYLFTRLDAESGKAVADGACHAFSGIVSETGPSYVRSARWVSFRSNHDSIRLSTCAWQENAQAAREAADCDRDGCYYSLHKNDHLLRTMINVQDQY